jgi:hypothetical protein
MLVWDLPAATAHQLFGVSYFSVPFGLRPQELLQNPDRQRKRKSSMQRYTDEINNALHMCAHMTTLTNTFSREQ